MGKFKRKRSSYTVMYSFFWYNIFCAIIILPVLPIASAYREWKFIEKEKYSDCSKWIIEFRIEKMWWKLLKTHYQVWLEKIKWYKAEREKIILSKNK